MSRFALIDAYNAMFRTWPEVPEDRDVTRHRLIRQTQGALGAHPDLAKAHLVFDTWPGAERAGMKGRDGRVQWSYATGSADEAILDKVRNGPTGIVVVTDDRELAGRCRQLGARTMGVRAFFQEAPPTVRPRPIPLDGMSYRPRDFELPEGEIDLLDPEDESL